MSRKSSRRARASYLGEKYSDEMAKVDRALERARNENTQPMDKTVSEEDARAAAERKHQQVYDEYAKNKRDEATGA